MKTIKSFLLANLFLGILLFGNTAFANKEGAPATLTIVEIASNDARFSILVDAVVKANLVDALSASGPYTVFAPTNDAFEELFTKMDIDGIEDLTAEQLKPILLYHVVSGKVMAEDVKSGNIPTLNDNATIDVMVKKGSVTINKNSKVIITDIESNNGVIHVVDEVLIPETKKSKASKSGGC